MDVAEKDKETTDLVAKSILQLKEEYISYRETHPKDRLQAQQTTIMISMLLQQTKKEKRFVITTK